jgi:anti-sigma regulatory factor (Ser/Thr protein kinase)
VIARQTCVPSNAAQLAALSRFLRDFWSEFNLPAAEALNFELALEEVFINVVMHGSDAAKVPSVEVSLTLVDSEVTLSVEDDGEPFDPLSLPAPDVTASLEGRRVGGLGVFLVRRVMDSVSYQRRGTINQLRMTKSLMGIGKSHV